ncbi:MAG: hypothetical protein GY928_19140 [Colwellia sp.]|nr:hypothetical protein [Colwellia sp.]
MNLRKELIEKRRKAALEEADRVYYDKKSPNYGNNQRFSWAVETINKGFDDEIKALESTNNGEEKKCVCEVPQISRGGTYCWECHKRMV